MKHLIIGLAALILTLDISAQDKKIDTVAIMVLDHMSAVIGDLNACSYTLDYQIDKIDPEVGFVSYFGISQVYFSGPDKMLVNINDDRGHRGYWYNGISLAYYSFDENNYVVIDAPPTIMETIDTIHECYGIDFPAADFFYPTFTEDLVNNSDQIIYNGLKTVEDKECFQIIAKSKDIIVQLWIANDALFLPVKFIILSYENDQALEYEATFSEWHINPELPKSMFEFIPPMKAKQVSILSKCSN
jgi:hypothetical protein